MKKEIVVWFPKLDEAIQTKQKTIKILRDNVKVFKRQPTIISSERLSSF